MKKNIIAVRSNKELTFSTTSDFKGIITRECRNYLRNVSNTGWKLDILEYCENKLGKKTRTIYPELTDKEVINLLSLIKIDFSDPTKLPPNLDEAFRQSLLNDTKMKCKTIPFYYGGSKIEDWEIVRIPDEITEQSKTN